MTATKVFSRQSLGQKRWAKTNVNMLMDVQFSSDRPSELSILYFQKLNSQVALKIEMTNFSLIHFHPQIYVDQGAFGGIQSVGHGECRGLRQHVESCHAQGQHRFGRPAQNQGIGLGRLVTRAGAQHPADSGVHGAHPLGSRVLRRQTHPNDDAEQRTENDFGRCQSQPPTQQQIRSEQRATVVVR